MSITLLFGVHAHQPVGNFPAVVEEAHARCYRPFLQTLHRFPEFHFSAHFSGWLLDFLLQKFPADMALLQEMVQRGQCELFGAGDCEPVLSAIPNRDRVGQLQALSQKLQRHFGVRPQGAWLTERVWEPTVVPALADCGLRYVAVDDYHFLCTGKTSGELDGFYTTEEDGRTLDLFPISEPLRYRLPFAPAPQVLAYLEQLADEAHGAAIYFDDIEKFGIWPETFAWVYEKRWLEQFLEAVLGSNKIRTATYAAYHAEHKTRGIVYLPVTSYIEMNEWTLPAPAAHDLSALIRQEKDAGHFERNKAFLRGGIWRNFFSRYPESNWMHKRMLALSQRLAALPPSTHSASLTEKLYRAQANDAYWHGLFGGLYLPHLRRAVWHNLVGLEAALDAASPRPPITCADVDHDGHDEIFMRNADLQAVIRLDGHAAPHEFDSYALTHNFGDTLRRSDEHYYARFAAAQPAISSEGIASAHERISFKHRLTAHDIIPDSAPCSLFCDRWRSPDGNDCTLHDYALQQLLPPLYATQFNTEFDGINCEKCFILEGERLVITYRFGGERRGRFSTHLNLAMPSCDGYGGRYILANGEMPCGFGQELELENLSRITLDDSELHGSLILSASVPLSFHAQPHFTVSQSEAGFEKIMQATVLTLSWPLDAETGEVVVSLEVVAKPASI